MTLAPVAPSANLFDRIISRLDDSNVPQRAPSQHWSSEATRRVRSPLSKRQRNWSYALAASVFIGLTAAFVQLMRPDGNDSIQNARLEQLAKDYKELLAREQRRPLNSNLRLVEMSGPTAAAAFVIWDLPSQQWHFHVVGLPPAPAGQAYQLWALTKSSAIPGPTFEPNAQGVGSAVGAFSGLSPLDGVRAAVTLEPKEGSERPTGDPLLEAAL